ncbi:MAG: hypothetical protein AB8H86_28600 [Polyangiales bacterium]
MTRLPAALLFLAGALACGPSGTSTEETTPNPTDLRQSGNDVPEPREEPQPEADPRRLAAGATFADLVGAAGALDARGGGQSSSGCLLEQANAGHMLRADVAIALRPAPAPPAVLTAAGDRVRVFSRWGQRGSGSPVLAALTATPPPAGGPALAVLINESSIALRSTDGSLVGDDVLVPSLASAMQAALQRGASRVFVSAAAGVSLTRLQEVLAALPAEAATLVVFAVALSGDTTLPDPPARGEGDTGMCSAMEPRTPGPTGDMDAAAAREALSGLSSASACLANAGPESASGGRLGLEIIVGPSGAVERACATSDEIEDSGVRTCVLDHVRALRFPTSSGEVTLRLPISLVPDRSEAPRALCR